VRVGDVEDATLFDRGAFDFAYLSHSFEHLDNPSAALTSLRHWLEDDARLFIAVPNFAGLLPSLFRPFWYNLALPLHVSQFTKRGITSLLESNGFVVERIVCNSDPVSIPMTLFFNAGGTVETLNPPSRYLLMAIAMACIPLSRALDWMGMGDCIEVHARKRAVS
jgi:SAM-dependent methyltransferase